MKKIKKSLVISMLLFASACLFFTGCAPAGISDTDSSASSAGEDMTAESSTDTNGQTKELLSIGETGSLQSLGAPDNIVNGSITIQEILTGDDAISLIKEFCSAEDALYSYQDPEDGYSWQAAKYSLSFDLDTTYTDIRIKGLDGEKLLCNGVSAPMRTYDIFSYAVQDESGMTDDLYCYYMVPDGCSAYMLECGLQVNGESASTACFYVPNT